MLPGLVERQARRTPDAIAVESGDVRTTYRELTARADRVARRLRAHGAGPDSLVGVCLDRGPELAAALLGVWKAGAGYVPLDPRQPAARLDLIQRDTAPRVTLTVPHLAHLVHEPLLIGTGDGPPVDPLPADPRSAAYVIHTSGSTGVPKAVVIEHAGIHHRVRWAVGEGGLRSTDRVLHKTSIGFDAHVWEIFAPLIIGGTVVMAPAGAESDPAALVGAIAGTRATVLQVVPSVLRLLVGQPGWRDCRDLRLLFSAGEPLTAELADRATEGLGVRLWNTYGPTECSIDVTAYPYERTRPARPVPIGRPLAGTSVFVLDERGEPAPIGVVGELYAGGAGVARGYPGRPGATADRFVPDPFGPPGARLYRTGDLARWRDDGVLEYRGRTDQQVKIDGVRVEPAEVEAVLATHPLVSAAVVTAFTAEAGVTRLGAHVAGPAGLDPRELRRHVADRLPAAFVPAAITVLDALPSTAGGKVDRRRLPGFTRADAGEAVSTPAERFVAEAWRAVLGVAPRGGQDDFFRLGGSSLRLAELRERLSSAGGGIRLADLFHATTVAAQARLLAAPNGPPETGVPRRVPGDRPLPLSYAQQRLWFLEKMSPGSPEWVTPTLVRLPAGTSPETVATALLRAAGRHEILRTRYAERDGVPVQVVGAPEPVELTVADTTRQDLAGHLAAAAARGFDLAAGPVWRALLARIPGEEPLLLVTVHHIASDGWSSAVLGRELSRACAGPTGAWPEPPVQYADFAVWQREHLTGAEAGRQLGYWRDRLDGLAPVELPADRPRPAHRDASGAVVPLRLPAALAGPLIDLGRRHGATPFMVLLTAFTVLLARYTGRWDVAVGTPVAGRIRPELDGVLGCFLNSLVLRSRLHSRMTFAEALAVVRETCLEAYAHQDVPFERVVEELRPGRDPSRTPLFQVLFELVEERVTSAPLRAEDQEALLAGWRAARTDLTLYLCLETDGGISGGLEFARALFDEATVTRLADHYVTLLRAVAADTGTPLAGLDLLAPAERALVTPPPAAGIDSGGLPLGAAFAARARLTPDAVAVISGGERLTYREVDVRANRLAHRLRAHGVGPGSLVAVHLPRDADLAPALIGVLKAGAAYVPLDPAHPVDRLAALLTDTGAPVLVTCAELAPRLAGGFAGTVVLTGGAGPADEPPAVAGLDDRAYVIFTSGSTGRPKGVEVTHRNVLRLMAAGRDLAGFGADDVWPLFHSYAFDLSVWEMWGALLYGGTLVVVPADVAREPGELADLMLEHGVTVLTQTPSAFRGLVRLAAGGDERIDRLRLRLVVFAGERLDVPELAPWVARRGLDAPVLANMYGITETTVHSTWHRVTAADLRPGAGNPIGVPLADSTIHLLDPAGMPAPIGVPGEIHVGGPGVARGYLARPGLTAQRFVPDPSGPPGSRRYRSGDLARRTPDGGLEFLGRLDDQVKIRGHRVEPGEVVAAIRAGGGVADAVVVVREDVPGDPRLTAYVRPAAGGRLDPAAVRADLSRRLPHYLVPAAVVLVDHIPLTANGKLDRRALPAPAGPSRPGGFRAPGNPLESALAEMWSGLLGAGPTGIDDDFFEAGGNSLTALRLSARIEAAYGVGFPVRAVFENPTVRRAAVAVEALLRAEIEAMSPADLARFADRP